MMLSVQEALQRVIADAQPLGEETATLALASGRVLSRDLKARLTQPPFDASAMDGYAIRAEDVTETPLFLRLIGESAAGHPFPGTVNNGEAVRISTGAPVPAGADTIVIQENTTRPGPGQVEILKAVRVGDSIRKSGADFSEGEIVLGAGQRLGSRQLMLAASANHPTLPVWRRPVAAILATGDELVTPGETPGAGQIVSSIPPALAAAVRVWGGEARVLPIARDTMPSLLENIDAARDADVLVTIGGASVGDHDLVHEAFKSSGATFDGVKVAMRPGKPVMFGRLGRQRLIGLPGNPASALLCALVFLKPLLQALGGEYVRPNVQTRMLTAPVAANGDRAHYMRAVLDGDGVAPLSDQDSSLVSALAKANCIIIRPPCAPAVRTGELVETLPLDF